MCFEFIVIYSPIDELYIISKDQKICSLCIGIDDFEAWSKDKIMSESQSNPILAEAAKQMNKYFSGIRTQFSLPLAYRGTDFQYSVWTALLTKTYGETKSYKEIAEMIGNPKAVRAVGQANRANQIPVIIPCHRVIGKNGKMTGYAGTRIDIKEKLLSLEGCC